MMVKDTIMKGLDKMKESTINITTERLVLRKFKEEDYKEMFDNWASNENVAKNAGWPVHTDKNDTKELVKIWVDEYKTDNTFNWIITLNDEAIGSITVVRKNIEFKTCELGYNIGEKFWNNGYATEAIKGVVDYLFSLDLFDTIYAECFLFNKASSRVLEKNGFKVDGILRNRYIMDNKKVSLIELSLLREEYEN